MNLPSNVPTYDSVPLVAFDHLDRRYIRHRQNRTLRAWPKAEETERRIDHFEWLAHVARTANGVQTFVLDLSTGFLLSFESTLQVLQDEKFPKGFDDWLGNQGSNDLIFRGLRTMRQLEAHIRAGTLTQRREGGHSRFTGSEGGSNIGWRWSQVTDQEYRSLKHKRLSQTELGDWNILLDERLIMDLMREGVTRLIALLDEAEK